MIHKLNNFKFLNILICLSIFLFAFFGVGVYWKYKVKNEMIVKFTQTDIEAPDFPVGERKINAAPWIQEGYIKLDQYRIYKPNYSSLVKDLDLAIEVSISSEQSYIRLPKLYNYFNRKGSLVDFLQKDISIRHLYSTFNPNNNLPSDDEFLVSFDDYEIIIQRKSHEANISLRGFDLNKAGSFEENHKPLMNKINTLKSNH